MAADDLDSRESSDAELKVGVARNFVRKALFRWTIRTLIGAVIFSWLAWNYTWGKYLLYVWIPMALLSLVVISIGGNQLKATVEDIERQLQELGEQEELE